MEKEHPSDGSSAVGGQIITSPARNQESSADVAATN